MLNRASFAAGFSVGSFANSLHLKCDDADRVAAAIDHLLQKQQWRPTEQVPDEDESRWGASGSRRAILVSAPVYGWVSVLDSDLNGELLLAEQLAEQLNAYSLLVLVNHSDSWGYVLARGDGPLDTFGLDDETGAGGMPHNYTEAEVQQQLESMAKIQAKLSYGTWLEQIQKLQQESIAQAPPEIQALHERIQRNEASVDEMVQFYNWNTFTNTQVTVEVQQVVGELLDLPGLAQETQSKPKKKRKRKPTKAQLAAAQQRIDNLRPLFVTEVTDEEVQALFDRKAHFAEETLAQFLPLFGIPSFYAYLDYSHHREASPEELAAHAIRFVHHLKYETNS